MPIEIRELIIRARVGAPDDPRDRDPDRAAPGPSAPGVDTDALVEECVRQVLKILRRERER